MFDTGPPYTRTTSGAVSHGYRAATAIFACQGFSMACHHGPSTWAIASSLVLPQLQQFGATGPGAILAATAGRIRGGCLSFTCEQCESVPCFNSVFRCMWRGQTTRRLPCGCHRKRSVITTPRIRRANVMVKQTPHDKVQYTFVLFIHILPHINLAPKCRHTGSLGLVVPDLLTGYRVGLKVSSSDTPKIPSIIMSSTHWILSVTTNKMSCNVKLRKLHISNHVSPPSPKYLAGSNLKD